MQGNFTLAAETATDLLMLRPFTQPGPSPATKTTRAPRSQKRKRKAVLVGAHLFFCISWGHKIVLRLPPNLLCGLLSERILQIIAIPWQAFFFFLKGSEKSRGHKAIFIQWGLGVKIEEELCAGVLLIKGTNAFMSDLERMTQANGKSGKCRCNYTENHKTRT